MEEQWEEINPMSDIPVWEYKKPGDEVMGVLQKVDKDIGPNHSRIYTIKQPDGSLIKVWGTTLLDTRFDFVAIGEKVRVVYQGKKDSQKGGRSYHDFKVYHVSAKHSENSLPDEDIPIIEARDPYEEGN